MDKTLARFLEECTERCRSMDAPLSTRLKAFADAVSEINPRVREVVDRMVARLEATGIGDLAPKPGEPMPDFMLPDQTGRLYSLVDFLDRGSFAVAFHRGHWCPYCRISAAALSAVHDEIRGQGSQLVAITPAIEKFNAELAGGAGASYPVLSDMDNAYALLLNLAFYVGDEMREFMRLAGSDLPQFNGDRSWTLPIPATFIVGPDGVVRARFVDPDYRRRMDTDVMLAELKAAR